MKKDKIPVQITQAKYQKSNIEDYKGNPLIEALPECLEPQRMRSVLSLSIRAKFDATLSQREREEKVREIRKTRIITRQHYDFYCEVYRMIRYGYKNRNPCSPQVIAWSYDIADPNVPHQNIDQHQLANLANSTTADCIFLTGFSGNGKSTMTEHVLFNLFPQVIEHDLPEFKAPQVIYLKVDIPHNASRPGLIYRLISALDHTLAQTSYGDPCYRNIARKASGKYENAESMMNILTTVVNRHHVGLLIIDEFQSIQVASPTLRDTIIQLFDELSNQLFVPNIKIGTPDTILLFDRNSRHKRRIGEPFELTRLSEPETWEQAMKALFEFQPVKHPIQRDKGIEDLLFNLTAGVPAYLVGTWEAALLEAIRSGKEKLTQASIKKAFNQRFPLLRSATRNINRGIKGRHADLLTVQQYLDIGNNRMALKHLEQFANRTEPQGIAAEEILEDINSSIDQNEFNPSQIKKLNTIKEKLAKSKDSKLPSQTIEHRN